MAGRHYWFGIAFLLLFPPACGADADREEVRHPSFSLGPGSHGPDETDVSTDEENRIVVAAVSLLGAFSSGSPNPGSIGRSAPPQTGSLCIADELAPSSVYDFRVQRLSPSNRPINRGFELVAKPLFAGHIQRRASLTLNPRELEEAGAGIRVERGCSGRLPPVKIYRPQVRGDYALIKFRAADICEVDHWMILHRSDGRWIWVAEAREVMFSLPFTCQREPVSGTLRISAQPARSSRSGTISPA